MSDQLRFGILVNETGDLSKHWESACKAKGYEYIKINLVAQDWLEQIADHDLQFFLLCPPGLQSEYKILYDERVYILSRVMGFFTYPSYQELLLHENKKLLSYFLAAQGIPHPQTKVFYDQKEAIQFANKCELPQVGKMNIGASGSGVRILKSRTKLEEYIGLAFSRGIKSSYGPNLKTGNYLNRLIYASTHPAHIIKRLKRYRAVAGNVQRYYIILQEYIPHDYEWRVVKIGSSFFGHQKTKVKDKASGSKGISYHSPPMELLNFAKDLCERQGFNSMAIDCFEDKNGGFLINELQTVFGHVQDHICEHNGRAGRWIFVKGHWVFEEGSFNSNLSYDLRFENVLDLIRPKI